MSEYDRTTIEDTSLNKFSCKKTPFASLKEEKNDLSKSNKNSTEFLRKKRKLTMTKLSTNYYTTETSNSNTKSRYKFKSSENSNSKRNEFTTNKIKYNNIIIN